MTVIVNGKSFTALWCWPPRSDNTLRMEIMDSRPLYEIAQEFEKADVIEKISPEEGNLKYIMNGSVLSIIRPDADKPNVQIIIARGEKLEYNPESDG